MENFGGWSCFWGFVFLEMVIVLKIFFYFVYRLFSFLESLGCKFSFFKSFFILKWYKNLWLDYVFWFLFW